MAVYPPKKGTIVQITRPDHHWYPCLVICSEAKKFGMQGYALIPHNNEKAGAAYIRLNYEDYEIVGTAKVVAIGE